MKWQPNAIARGELRRRFEEGVKGRDSWRIGIERERVVLLRDGLKPLAYDGPNGVAALLEELAQRFGWERQLVDGKLLALKRDAAQVTVEPACQLEFSTTPLTCVDQVYRELKQWEEELAQTSLASKLCWIDAGLNPFYTPEQLNWIPKERYHIMRRILPQRSALGLEMMSMTASIQVSVDYESEADCEEKFRVACALVPLFTALYANSPIRGGVKSGFMSYRSHIWTKTDPARCGIPSFAFDGPDGRPLFDRYTDYALDVPMFFLHGKHGGEDLIEARREDGSGWKTFREVLAASNGVVDQELWGLHLSTLFPEVRLKQYLEIRTPDCNEIGLAMSFAALCKALLYHTDARREVASMLEKFDMTARLDAQRSAAALGLSAAKFGRYRMLELAAEIYGLAESAIKNLDGRCGATDAGYLAPLAEQIFEFKCSPAEQLLKLWDGPLRGQPQELIKFLSSTKPPSSRFTRDNSAI